MMTYQTAEPTARLDADDKAIALLNYILLLAGFLTSGITSVVAVILAYVRRDGADPLGRSHMGFQISTFWIGFIGTAAGLLLMLGAIVPLIMAGASSESLSEVQRPDLAFSGVALLVVGGLILLVVQVAVLVRSIYGLIKLASEQPMRGR